MFMISFLVVCAGPQGPQGAQGMFRSTKPSFFGPWELIFFGLWELIFFGLWELIFFGLWELIFFGLWELIFFGLWELASERPLKCALAWGGVLCRFSSTEL